VPVFDPAVFDPSVFLAGTQLEAGFSLPVESAGYVTAEWDLPVESMSAPVMAEWGLPVESLAELSIEFLLPVESDGTEPVGAQWALPVESVGLSELEAVWDLPVDSGGFAAVEAAWDLPVDSLGAPLLVGWDLPVLSEPALVVPEHVWQVLVPLRSEVLHTWQVHAVRLNGVRHRWTALQTPRGAVHVWRVLAVTEAGGPRAHGVGGWTGPSYAETGGRTVITEFAPAATTPVEPGEPVASPSIQRPRAQVEID
jgi:hypothetical protein